MSKDLTITTSGDRASKARETWRPSAAPARPENRSAAPGSSDEVRLSKLHQALTFSEISTRVERLELEVARQEYSVPAIEISRGIIREHLAAAGN
jgi:hypothetical protein